LEYLVKWKELGYDECTWELEDNIAAFGDAIDRFRRFRKKRKRSGGEGHEEGGGEKKRKRLQKVGDVRRGKGGFEKMEETPEYLVGGRAAV
jgi:chromodomain-helicase-DNA-binding protein 4